MRLGDLDELKKYKFTTQIANGVEIEDIEVVPVAAIDNALTVKFSLMPADETKEDAYKRGYERGKIAGILKANTRPRGKWIHRRVIAKDRSFDVVVCSNCRTEFSWDAETGVSMDNYGTCPNCTADMQKGGAE